MRLKQCIFIMVMLFISAPVYGQQFGINVHQVFPYSPTFGKGFGIGMHIDFVFAGQFLIRPSVDATIYERARVQNGMITNNISNLYFNPGLSVIYCLTPSENKIMPYIGIGGSYIALNERVLINNRWTTQTFHRGILEIPAGIIVDDLFNSNFALSVGATPRIMMHSARHMFVDEEIGRRLPMLKIVVGAHIYFDKN